MMKKFAAIIFIITLAVCFTANAQNDWTGIYEFNENGGKTSGGTPIQIYHTIEVRESADGLMATIKSDGFQTSAHLICTTKTENNKLHFYFADYGEENLFENYKEGDLLLSLERKNDQILTHWGKFQPKIESNNKSGKIYFKKTD